MKSYTKLLVAVLIGTAIGFWYGRQTRTDRIYYEKLPTISGKIDSLDLKPVSSILRDSIQYVTIYQALPSGLDTEAETSQEQQIEATVVDWNIERTYNTTLFDTPELGKLELTSTVFHNRLQGLSYDFAPVQRVELRTRKWQPFVSVSYNSFDQFGVGLGVFRNHWGFEVQGLQQMTGGKSRGVGFAIKYKF